MSDAVTHNTQLRTIAGVVSLLGSIFLAADCIGLVQIETLVHSCGRGPKTTTVLLPETAIDTDGLTYEINSGGSSYETLIDPDLDLTPLLSDQPASDSSHVMLDVAKCSTWLRTNRHN